MAFIPSPQQQAVFNWAVSGSGSAFVQAVAGAGKTTTLIELCKYLKGSVAFVAFNKKIVTEIEERLAKKGLRHIQAATFHSLGFTALKAVYGKYLKVDARAKQKELIEKVGIPAHMSSFVFALVSQAKNRAIAENEINNVDLWWDIINHFDMLEQLENPDDADEAIRIAQKTLRESIFMSKRIIDFDDMIYVPVIKNFTLSKFDWVLTDEAQDTNPVRRAFARLLMNDNSRSVWVGDKAQSIYGFAGADADAVDNIIRDFNCAQLPLTVTYRCPKVVVARARALGPDMTITAHESAPEGIERTISDADLVNQNLVAADAILCRKTAPLVEQAFRLIKKGIPCHVEGKEIGTGLIKLVTRYKAKTVTTLIDKLKDYCERECAKLIAKNEEVKAESLRDRVETVFVLAEGCDTIDCIKAKINNLFQDSEGNKKPTLTLSTVHKAKGREWHRVFILGYNQYMPSKAARQDWQKIQEMYLQNVALTRSKFELVYVDVEAK